MEKIFSKQTQFFGVLGYPVGHSRSPELFNKLFNYYKNDGLYHFLETKDPEKTLEACRVLGYRGLSITIPFKEVMMKFVDELDELAKNVGCINTISFENGILKGYNTDGLGFIESLSSYEKNWSSKNILFLGTGGSARGISMAMGVQSPIKKLFFLSRKKEVPFLADLQRKNIEVKIFSYEELEVLFSEEKIDIIVNTTPLGMHPKVEETALNKKYLRGKIVFDIVYNPLETRLLREAKEGGAKIIYGVEMFLEQARLQYEIWFGSKPSREIVREIFLGNAHGK